MNIRELIVSSRTALSEHYPEDEARSIVALLAGELLGVEPYAHIIEPESLVPDDRLEFFLSAMGRLKCGEPIQYVLGFADFCGFRFRVTPNVLIPRPETEILCRETIAAARAILRARQENSGRCASFKENSGRCASFKETSRLKIADLCTGSGCIAWTLALSLPESSVVGTDISEAALSVAKNQAAVRERCSRPPLFVRHNILSSEESLQGEGVPDGFDIIVSNPPYVRESERSLMRRNVTDFEPSQALFVPDEDPLKFYRSVAEFSKKRMISGGFGMVEINEAFGDATAAVFSSAGMSQVRIVQDFGGKNRFICYTKS